MNHQRPGEALATTGLLLSLAGCSVQGAPSFILFGAYFPGWMLCGLLGIAGAIGVRILMVRPLPCIGVKSFPPPTMQRSMPTWSTSQRRVLSSQRSAATVAGDQVKRAATNLELAKRTVERLGSARVRWSR